MTKIKVNHYGAKTVAVSATVDWESLLMEVLIAFLLGVFAYMGYMAKIPLLFFPCAIGSVLCFFAFLYAIYVNIGEKRELRKANKNIKNDGDEK